MSFMMEGSRLVFFTLGAGIPIDIKIRGDPKWASHTWPGLTPGHDFLRGHAIDDRHKLLFLLFWCTYSSPSYCEQHKRLILFKPVLSSDTQPPILRIELEWTGTTTWMHRVSWPGPHSIASGLKATSKATPSSSIYPGRPAGSQL